MMSAEQAQNVTLWTEDGKRHDFNGLYTGLTAGAAIVRITVGDPFDLPPGCTWSTIGEVRQEAQADG